MNVLGKKEEAFSALDQHKYDKAKQALSEGIELVKLRLKLIRIADKSECGWKTVDEYVANKLADNSDDEKRLYHSEQQAQRKICKTMPNSNRSTTSTNVASNHNQSQSSPTQFNAAHKSSAEQRIPPYNYLGPCFFVDDTDICGIVAPTEQQQVQMDPAHTNSTVNNDRIWDNQLSNLPPNKCDLFFSSNRAIIK